MRPELLHMFTNVTDTNLMVNMMHNMDMNAVSTMTSTLQHADESTENRWLSTYNNTMRLA